MTEEQLQWLIVKLRIAIADLLNPGNGPEARAAAENLIGADASGSKDYPFDFERLKQLGDIPDWEDDPYPVKCARCGKAGTSATFEIEEGDEWECPECWERCNAQEAQSSDESKHKNAET